MPDEGGKVEVPPIAGTATLEVSPQQAEMITLAQTLGTLSLVLNSVRDGGDPDSASEVDSSAGAKISTLELVTEGLLPRRMTLDSDVTSLLQRQLAAQEDEVAPGVSPVPPSDRTLKVQVVRGVQTQAVQLGVESAATADAAAGTAPEAAADPAAAAE
jgi:hypothetical protein